MKNIIKNQTPLGTFLKAFLATVLTQYLIELQQGTELFSWDMPMLQKLLTAGVVANLPSIINYLNPYYKGYGLDKKTPTDEPTN
jgi:hypothetical protein